MKHTKLSSWARLPFSTSRRLLCIILYDSARHYALLGLQVVHQMNAQNLTTFWCSAAKIQEFAEEAWWEASPASFAKQLLKNFSAN